MNLLDISYMASLAGSGPTPGTIKPPRNVAIFISVVDAGAWRQRRNGRAQYRASPQPMPSAGRRG